MCIQEKKTNNNNNNNNHGSGAPGGVKNEISNYQLPRLRGEEKVTHKQSVVGKTNNDNNTDNILLFDFVYKYLFKNL